MSVFTLSSLVGSLTALLVGQYVYYLDRKNALNRAFLVFSFVSFLVVFGEFMYRQADTVASASWWLHWYCLWPFSLAAQLVLIIFYTERKGPWKSFPAYALIAGVALSLSIQSYRVSDLVRESWGWMYVHNGSYLWLVLGSAATAVLSICLLVDFILRTPDRRKRRQAKYLLAAIALPTASGIITGSLAPVMQVSLPHLTSFLIPFQFLLFAYGIGKYELFTPDCTIAAEGVFSSISEMLFIADTQGNILRINRPLAETLGCAEKDMVGKPVSALFADAHWGRTVLGESLAGRTPVAAETELRTGSGGTIAVDFTTSLLRDRNNRTVGMIGIARDITERKRMEETLRHGQEFSRALLENIVDGVVACDSDGKLVLFNRAARNWHGLDPTNIPPEEWADYYSLYHEDGVTLMDASSIPLLRAFRGEVLHDEGMTIRAKGQPIRHLLANGSPFFDEQGRKLGAVVVMHDITERKRIEEGLRKARQRDKLAMDLAKLVRWEFDAATQMFTFDDQFYALYHTTAEREGGVLMSAQTYAQKFLPPEEAPLVGRAVSETLSGAGPDTMQIEHRIVRADGTEGYIVVRIAKVKDAEGRVIGSYGANQDITERKLLEDRLLQSEKMAVVGNLAGGIAHDFNNLLNVIIGYCDIMKTAYESGGQATLEDIEEVRQAAKRASTLTSQLLSYSRKQPIRPAVMSLNRTVAGLEGMLRRLIGEDIELKIALDPQLKNVVADNAQMEQVVLNLAGNARDAMPNGGTLSIMTENIRLAEGRTGQAPDARPGEFVCLSVEDTGSGMDHETIRHIFEPYYTTKDRGKGTGLGLSVTYGIVRQHDGWIEANSMPGSGSQFNVYLPAHSEKAGDTAAAAPPRAETEKGNGERILLVEDEAAIRNMGARILRESNYRVVTAGNAGEALEIFQRENGDFDLLFTDTVMPGKSGLELAQHLLSLKPGLGVLISSGYLDDKSKADVIREQGYGFLPKPYGLRDLLAAVREKLRS